MIRAKLKKTGEWLSFDSYEDIVICLRAKAKLWRAKENDSNDRYKKQVIKRIKRMYGVTYENKNQIKSISCPRNTRYHVTSFFKLFGIRSIFQ